MKKIILMTEILLFFCHCGNSVSEPRVVKESPNVVEKTTSEKPVISSTEFSISSTAFEQNGYIPSKYTCDGANVSPPLSIQNVPTDAKSLSIIVNDPDAQSGNWIHWLVWNIDPKTTSLTEQAKPVNSIQGITSFGDIRYQGPCPPSGTHHYYFTVYALDTMLDIKDNSKVASLEEAMQGHIVGKTELIGLYSSTQ